MVETIVFIVAVIIGVAVLVWATDFLTMLTPPIVGIIKFLWVLLGVALIVHKVGLI